MSKRFLQGRYTPKNPHKYVGDLNKIVYRSSYELEMHSFLDANTRVLHWSSEEVVIPYLNVLDGKIHKYFPDYFVEYVNKDGEIIKEIIEVKPKAQTHKPRGRGKWILYEQQTYIKNVCKWQAAQAWCTANGIKFRIITEKSLFA